MEVLDLTLTMFNISKNHKWFSTLAAPLKNHQRWWSQAPAVSTPSTTSPPHFKISSSHSHGCEMASHCAHLFHFQMSKSFSFLHLPPPYIFLTSLLSNNLSFTWNAGFLWHTLIPRCVMHTHTSVTGPQPCRPPGAPWLGLCFASPKLKRYLVVWASSCRGRPLPLCVSW